MNRPVNAALLAVAILGVSFAVLLTGASRCLGVIKLARNYQEAQWTFSMGEAENPILATNAVEDIAVSPVTYDNGFTFWREVEEDEDETEEEDPGRGIGGLAGCRRGKTSLLQDGEDFR